LDHDEQEKKAALRIDDRLQESEETGKEEKNGDDMQVHGHGHLVENNLNPESDT
jgi:hypothetical protein